MIFISSIPKSPHPVQLFAENPHTQVHMYTLFKHYSLGQKNSLAETLDP